MTVVLSPVDNEEALSGLLDLAVRGASPEEVMPPVDGPPGWTLDRVEAFREFHRARFGGLDGVARTVMYAIVMGEDVVGMIRLSLVDAPDTAETGIWVGRSHRGQGLAAAALEALLDQAGAAGARTVIAETTPANAAALGVLRGRGAVLTDDEGKVRASIEVPQAGARETGARETGARETGAREISGGGARTGSQPYGPDEERR